jgi:hypothetical protein
MHLSNISSIVELAILCSITLQLESSDCRVMRFSITFDRCLNTWLFVSF